MTEDEAIEFIKTDIARLWNTPQCNLHKDALLMAIKALKEKEAKKNEICSTAMRKR